MSNYVSHFNNPGEGIFFINLCIIMTLILSTEIEVIEQFYEDVAEAISSDLTYYSGQFVECSFIPHASAQLVCEAPGKNEGEKAVVLLDAVIHHLKFDEHRKDAFEKLVHTFSISDNNVAQNMAEKYGKYNVHVPVIIQNAKAYSMFH